jgi:hypothetical protein
LQKIIHVDTDAFYASVEQHDNPQLRGTSVIIAWLGNRSVVCAASQEAMSFSEQSSLTGLRRGFTRTDEGNRSEPCIYQLFEERRYEHGHDFDDWLQAKAEII